MSNLTDISAVRAALNRHGVILKKSMGQNFLINPSVCPRMADGSGIDENTGVIEIGPGIGVLTVELAKRSKRVVAVELDTTLKGVLMENLSGFDNASVIFGDIMKTDVKKLIEISFSDCERVAVCANLPYYITSPIVMSLLENKLPISTITVMVQKEAAERMCARVGSRESGAVTVAVCYYAKPEILFGVSAGSFLPAPKVDSAVMRLELRDAPEYDVGDEKTFFAFVKAGFSQRRKTLLNAASSTRRFTKERLSKALETLDIDQNARIESLSMDKLAAISRLLS